MLPGYRRSYQTWLGEFSVLLLNRTKKCFSLKFGCWIFSHECLMLWRNTITCNNIFGHWRAEKTSCDHTYYSGYISGLLIASTFHSLCLFLAPLPPSMHREIQGNYVRKYIFSEMQCPFLQGIMWSDVRFWWQLSQITAGSVVSHLYQL